MVQTPTPPNKMDRKLRAAVRTDAKEVSRRRRDNGLMGMGTSVGTDIRRPQEKVGPTIRRHRQKGNLRGGRHSAPTGEVGSSRQAPTGHQ